MFVLFQYFPTTTFAVFRKSIFLRHDLLPLTPPPRLRPSGDLKNEDRILEWLLVEKNPGSEVIEELAGRELLHQIEHSDAIAVFFCESAVGRAAERIM